MSFSASRLRMETAIDQARNIPQHGEGVVVVKMTAKALLITQSGDANHHGVRELTVGEKGQGGGLATQLVFRVVQVGQKLDFRDG